MKRLRWLLALVVAALGFAAEPASPAPVPLARARGVVIQVSDLARAVAFYAGTLGFEIASRSVNEVELATGDPTARLLLRAAALPLRPALSGAEGPATFRRETRVGLTLQVNDLDATLARLQAKGVTPVEAEKRTEGVGMAISVADPDGNELSLMHQTIRKVEPFKEPRIYNYGLTVPIDALPATQALWRDALGFVELSQKYLPRDMPLGYADRALGLGFMLHFRPVAAAGNVRVQNTRTMLLLETADPAALIARAERGGATRLDGAHFADHYGNMVEVRAP